MHFSLTTELSDLLLSRLKNVFLKLSSVWLLFIFKRWNSFGFFFCWELLLCTAKLVEQLMPDEVVAREVFRTRLALPS